jgi:hypothetical protein
MLMTTRHGYVHLLFQASAAAAADVTLGTHTAKAALQIAQQSAW